LCWNASESTYILRAMAWILMMGMTVLRPDMTWPPRKVAVCASVRAMDKCGGLWSDRDEERKESDDVMDLRYTDA